MNKKVKIAAIVVVVGGVSFYSGLKYDQSRNSASLAQGVRSFANLSPEERQTRMQQFGAGGGQRSARAGGGAASGEVISKDDKSVTVKLRDGGSKIIFLSDATSVAKSVDGSAKDITVGEQITASGSPNSDGSITAQSVQIRPPQPPNK